MEGTLDCIKLTKPRRKRRRFTKLEFPFPVPLQKTRTSNVWYYYEGHLRCNCVIVQNVGDLTFLYKMGFFGKGVLSRSKPEHEKISSISQLAFSNSDKLRRLPPRERIIRQSKFQKCRKERYRQHSMWSRMSTKQSIGSEDASAAPTDESLISCEEACGSKEDVTTDHDDKIIDDGDGDDDGDYSDDDVKIDDVIMELVNKEVHSSTCQGTDSSGKSKKEDPYQIYEFLQLTLEEAFFLSFGLGSLTVLLDNQKLSLSAMWSEFCRRNTDFFRNYIAYHYYRSKGWVPQVGLKYGSDLVLYKKGMPFFHSSYAVVTSLVNEEGKRLQLTENVSSGQKWTWKSLASMNRLNEHVAKELLLCSITIPSEKQEEALTNAHNLRGLTIQETIVRRWIPRKAREPSSED